MSQETVIFVRPQKVKVPLHDLIANKDICIDKHRKSCCGLAKWINICSHIMILNVKAFVLFERMLRQFSRDLCVMQLEQTDWPVMYARLVTLCRELFFGDSYLYI